jgi:uncharacterized protein YbaR (Trm112 family)
MNDKSQDNKAQEEKNMTETGLLDLLVCPLTRTTLQYDARKQELISRSARLAFPIREGVPVLIEDEARRLDDGE